MDARELRIGNLVLDPEGLVSKILSISTESNSTDGKYYLENDYNGHPEDLRSIPLTEEWLLKLGFIQNESKSLTLLCRENEFIIDPDVEKIEIVVVCQDNEDFVQFNCSFVHQLQNLYFALTGEELTIRHTTT